MSEIKDAEKIQTAEATPAPQPPAPQAETKAESVEVKPVDAKTESIKKQEAAFIKMRQENRELKKKMAAATVTPTLPPATETPEAATEAPKVVPQAPAPAIAENDIAKLEKQAIKELSEDKALAKIPGGVMEVLNAIDEDPRLTRLYNEIDPGLAIREAKNLYLSKMGVAETAPAVPVSKAPTGGVGGGGVDLDALIAEADKHRPGTLEWHKAVQKVNAELKRLGR